MMSNKQPPQPPSTLCEQTQEAILTLLDDEFDAEQQAILAQHLPDCKACQAYQESMQHLTLSLRKMDEVPVPAGLEDRIMNRIAQENENKPSRQDERERVIPLRKSSGPKMAPIAAAIMTLALAIPLVYQAVAPNLANHTTMQANAPQNIASRIPSQTAAPAPKLGAVTGSSNAAVSPKPTTTDNEEGAPTASADDNSAASNNPTDVADALPTAMSVDNAYASKKEGDTYYDPVSNLVEF